jgi:predicted O-methyltransferase YrrM
MPVSARHVEMSVISSADDLVPQPNDFLISTLAEAAMVARSLDVSSILDRCMTDEDRTFVETWPGEHYRLLAALAQVIGAERVVEVGTYRGHGTLALHLGAANVVTYDIFPFNDFENSVLRAEDFNGGIEQRIRDLSDPLVFQDEMPILKQAQMIFVDGPKDGVFEKQFAQLLLPALEGTNALVVWDDTRVMAMVDFWRWLPVPKLDATSFGHWSGTGLSQFS